MSYTPHLIWMRHRCIHLHFVPLSSYFVWYYLYQFPAVGRPRHGIYARSHVTF